MSRTPFTGGVGLVEAGVGAPGGARRGRRAALVEALSLALYLILCFWALALLHSMPRPPDPVDVIVGLAAVAAAAVAGALMVLVFLRYEQPDLLQQPKGDGGLRLLRALVLLSWVLVLATASLCAIAALGRFSVTLVAPWGDLLRVSVAVAAFEEGILRLLTALVSLDGMVGMAVAALRAAAAPTGFRGAPRGMGGKA